MKIKYEPTDAEVRAKRKEEYLYQFPIETQLEALFDAAAGDTTKMELLLEAFKKIKTEIPFVKGEKKNARNTI